MHILIIPSEEYIPIEKPIAGIFQHDQAKVLRRHNNKVGVISFSFKYSVLGIIKALFGKNESYKLSFFELIKLFFVKTTCAYKKALSYEEIDCINVVRCDGFWGVKNSRNDLSKYELWIKYGEYALKKYIDKYGKPDVIHAHNMVYAGLMAYEVADRLNIPVIITEHSSEYAMSNIKPNIESLLFNVFNKNKFIYAVSPALQVQLTKRFLKSDNKIGCLPNVLDPSIEYYPYNERNKLNKKLRFLNIGNLIPLKGQTELIQAFYEAFKERNDVELIIGGKGYLKDTLNQLINSLELEGKVKLKGYLPRDKVVEEMDASNVFILPSHYETFGVVLIEALSRGMPLISTYCGGPEGIVDDENGVLVKPKNVNELKEALIKMAGSYNKYQSKKIRENCLETYGEQTFYNKIKSIYAKM